MEQTAVLCCHFIQTKNTDFSEAICLGLLMFNESCANDEPSPTVDLFKLMGVSAFTASAFLDYVFGVTEKSCTLL